MSSGAGSRKRRPRGEGGLSWDDKRQRFIASKTVGFDGRGKRIVKRASGKTEASALRALRERVRDYEAGMQSGADFYTVGDAIDDWLELGQGAVSAATVEKHRFLALHVVKHLGGRRLRELRADEVDRWLLALASEHTTRTLREIRAVLHRAIDRAVVRGMAVRNVVDFVQVPRGREGRRSRSLTTDQALEVLRRTRGHPLHAYIVVSLTVGLRTEEVRALQWANVDLEGLRDRPPSVNVWRSSRVGGDTKTRASRRTLALPAVAVEALTVHRSRQHQERLRAGRAWHDLDLVFASRVGTELDAGNVRRAFRDALRSVPGLDPQEWTPRDLRHSFVSIMSEQGVPLEEISRLVGHSGTAVTEQVYRHELRPVLREGADVFDGLGVDLPPEVRRVGG